MAIDFKKLSILLVEDTLPMRDLMIAVLETLGVGKVYGSSNGEHAFELFCNKQPDIVIADWHMEPMDGIELTMKIRNDDKSPNKMVPIIMISGYSELFRVSQARDAGVTEFIVKPFAANDIAKRLTYVVNKPRDFIRAPDYFGPDRRRRNIPNYTGPHRRDSDGKKKGSGDDFPVTVDKT